MYDKERGATENQWEDLRKPGDERASRKKNRERFAAALADIAMLGPVHPEEKEEIGLMAVEMYAAETDKIYRVNQNCPKSTKSQFLSYVCQALHDDVRDFEFEAAIKNTLTNILDQYHRFESPEVIDFQNEISDELISSLISQFDNNDGDSHSLTNLKHNIVCEICDQLCNKVSEDQLEGALRDAYSMLNEGSRQPDDDIIEELDFQNMSSEQWSELFLCNELPSRELSGGDRIPREKALGDFIKNIAAVLYETGGAAEYQMGVESAIWKVFYDRAHIMRLNKIDLSDLERARNDRPGFNDPLEDEFAFELVFGDGSSEGRGEESDRGPGSAPYLSNPRSERARMLRLCELFEERDGVDSNFVRSLSERLERVPRNDLTNTFDRVDEDASDFPPLLNTLELSEEELENLREEFERLKDHALDTAQKLFLSFNGQMNKFQAEDENLREWAEVTRPYFEEENRSRLVPDDLETPAEYRSGTNKDPRLVDWGPFESFQDDLTEN